MITLRVNPYNQKELERLADLLKASENLLTTHFCKSRNCKICDYRHLCYDLTSARKHAEKLVNEAMEHAESLLMK